MRLLPLKTIRRCYVALLEGAIILIMAALVLDVAWQVATRYLLGNPSSWTDEFATMLMIWVAALGASLGFLRHSHLGIDYVVNKLPRRFHPAARGFVLVLISLFAGLVLVYGGSELVSMTLKTKQLSPALGFKMGLVYLAIPISGVFILLFTVEELVGVWSRKSNDTASTAPPEGSEE